MKWYPRPPDKGAYENIILTERQNRVFHWRNYFEGKLCLAPPVADRMLQDTFLLLLLSLQKHYSTLIAQWWQCWASGLQIWLVVGERSSPWCIEITQSPNQPRAYKLSYIYRFHYRKGILGLQWCFPAVGATCSDIPNFPAITWIYQPSLQGSTRVWGCSH